MKRNKHSSLSKILFLGIFLCQSFLSYAFSPPNNADINITGKVTSDKNEALVGVSIRVEGTDKGTITDVDGNFALVAPSDGVLIFTFIGYDTQKVPVNNQSVINVSLMTSSSS
jgi:CarboxypepD_reg-like domain